jgi:hypothetical protein
VFLLPAYYDTVCAQGHEAASAWGDKNGFWKLEEINELINRVAGRMIAERPKTTAGIATVAASLKEFVLSHHWLAISAVSSRWELSHIACV